jgi:outer membrane receptor protein involved in Fe transport
MSGNLKGGVGPSLASQGFVTGVGTRPGFSRWPLDRRYRERHLQFVHDGGADHQSEAGEQYLRLERQLFEGHGRPHAQSRVSRRAYEQVNVNPNPTFNGSFCFPGTGNRPRLRGLPDRNASFYNQADSQLTIYGTRYAGGYVQDSWRLRPNLTLNYGVRWDHMEYWSEKYNQIPTYSW